jgi:hypothetical protein
MTGTADMSRAKHIIERISSVVYHSTDDVCLMGILRDNYFRLSDAPSDQMMNPPDKPYSFCVSRSRRNSYRTVYSNVLLELDGDKFNNRYSGHAVDWQYQHQSKDYSRGHDIYHRVEAEDRVFSYTNNIPDACSYIKAIYIYLGPYTMQSLQKERVRQGYLDALDKGLPVYVYDKREREAFFNLDQSKAMSKEEIQEFFSDV